MSSIGWILSKLRFPLKQELGGTGKTSMGEAAVGTVSQVAGVPTGAIIEYTVGINGDCIRYADGTQICTLKGSIVVDLTTATASFFTHGGEFTIAKPYAKPFITAPAVSNSYSQSGWYGFSQVSTLPTATNWPALKGFSMASVSGVTITYTIIAIGRWF